MNFDKFEATFMTENRKLRVMMGISRLIFLALLSLMIFEKKYFIYQGHEIFEERILSEKVCLEGFQSIIGGSPDSSVVADGIISLLKSDPFELTINKVLKLESVEKNFCKIVIESEKKLMAFKMGLSEDDSNPFFYKVLSIDELALKE